MFRVEEAVRVVEEAETRSPAAIGLLDWAETRSADAGAAFEAGIGPFEAAMTEVLGAVQRLLSAVRWVELATSCFDRGTGVGGLPTESVGWTGRPDRWAWTVDSRTYLEFRV